MSLFSKKEKPDSTYMQGMWIDVDKTTFVFSDKNDLTILTASERQVDSENSLSDGVVTMTSGTG